MAWASGWTPKGTRFLLLAVGMILGLPFLSLLGHRSASPSILFYSAEYAAALGVYAVFLLVVCLGAFYPSSVGRYVLQGLAVLVLAFCAAEVGSRLDLLGPFSALTAFRQHQGFARDLGYRFFPDRSWLSGVDGEPPLLTRVHRFGSEDIGFRSQAHSGRVQVIAVGDGATFGSGLELEETWVALVGQTLHVETFNFGMPATGPAQYLRVLERYGLKLQPRLVLFAFYTGSDFFDDWAFEKWRRSGTSLDIVQFALFGRSSMSVFLGKHSVAFSNGAILYNRLVKVGQTVTVATKDGPLILHPAPLDMTGEAVQEGWRLARESMRNARRLVTNAGAEFVVVILPIKEGVYLPVVPGLERFRREQADWQAAHQTLVSFLQEDAFTFCDTLPPLQSLARRGLRLFFEKGVYLNRTGHREVAAFVASCLQARGIIR